MWCEAVLASYRDSIDRWQIFQIGCPDMARRALEVGCPIIRARCLLHLTGTRRSRLSRCKPGGCRALKNASTMSGAQQCKPQDAPPLDLAHGGIEISVVVAI